MLTVKIRISAMKQNSMCEMQFIAIFFPTVNVTPELDARKNIIIHNLILSVVVGV